MTAPYYTDESVTLYHGDALELMPTLTADVVVTDPPYGETALKWDRWPDGWPSLVASAISQLWCFGSLRMFVDRSAEFAGWRFAQDLVWEKPNGSMFAADRFKRVHEHVTHWYRGQWTDVYHAVQRVKSSGLDKSGRATHAPSETSHLNRVGRYEYVDDGTRLMRSVIQVNSMHSHNVHPTEKPTGIIEPIIAYSCPPGGVVLDPFAGSGSTLDATRRLGRKAIGIEAHEPYCEIAAKRLAQDVLDFGGAA